MVFSFIDLTIPLDERSYIGINTITKHDFLIIFDTTTFDKIVTNVLNIFEDTLKKANETGYFITDCSPLFNQINFDNKHTHKINTNSKQHILLNIYKKQTQNLENMMLYLDFNECVSDGKTFKRGSSEISNKFAQEYVTNYQCYMDMLIKFFAILKNEYGDNNYIPEPHAEAFNRICYNILQKIDKEVHT